MYIDKDNKSSQQLIFFGGYIQTNISKDQYLSNEIYSIKLNTCELIKLQHEADGRKPKPRRGHAGCIVNNYMVVMGGKNENSDYRDDLWIFVFRPQKELGEKQGWYKLQVLSFGETKKDPEFTDLCHHTMTYIPSTLKSSELNNSVPPF